MPAVCTRTQIPVLPLVSLFLLLATTAMSREADRDSTVMQHARTLESAAQLDREELLGRLEADHLAGTLIAETTRAERRAILDDIAAAAAVANGVLLAEADGVITLTFEGPEPLAVRFTVETEAPYAILSLDTSTRDVVGFDLTWQSAAATFAELERRGFTGAVHLQRDGKTVLHRAYGDSNAELGYRTQTDTAFGIGSTPIDFTVAGLLLLAQQGKVKLDDTIERYFDNVPADKASLTIRHLISGQSGLPDFHNTQADWDPDLAWVDRETAVRRILGQDLLFAPGTGRAHSHSAYGLVAAIIEVVSGQTWFEFMSANIFEPAGMRRTGMYGSSGGLSLRDFAVGRGPESAGLPNIPPNWGPTSWLVLGSGGMYSTLEDMLRFYRFIESGDRLRGEYLERMRGETVGVGGSVRGYYFFHASDGNGDRALMLVSGEGRGPELRALSRALEDLVIAR